VVTSTVVNYLPFARKFLVERFPEGPLLLSEVTSSDVSAFVLRHAETMRSRRLQLMATAFRSFFRFLFQNGELQANLAAAVPAIAGWRLSTVPKYLGPKEVDRVLAGCDRQTQLAAATSRFFSCSLVSVSVLGKLLLFNLMTSIGGPAILVRGKGLLHDRMPLPVDVGEALTTYLRTDRPPCKTRRVFVCMKAPRCGFAGPSTLTTIVRRALDGADLHPAMRGAHVLRHSLATTMLRSGASMTEIGEILRHRTPNATEIYAKLDFDGLRSLAHPWPSVGCGR
jgi:integrase/recombinase XerD